MLRKKGEVGADDMEDVDVAELGVNVEGDPVDAYRKLEEMRARWKRRPSVS